MLLDGLERLGLEFLLVDELGRFLVGQLLQRIPDLEFARLAAIAAEVLEHALQLARHLFHAWRRHDLDTDRNGLDLDFDLLVVELALAQHLAKFLPCIACPSSRSRP